DVVPGVQAMAAPGHTVGHTIFIIKSENKTLAFTGDTTHHQILLTETPRTEFVYDTDPKQAVASRLKVLDMLASQKLPLHAYHFPWPGYGYVAKQGDGCKDALDNLRHPKTVGLQAMADAITHLLPRLEQDLKALEK